MSKPLFALAAATAVLSFVAVNNASADAAAKKDMEKCYGIVKAGKNDCAAKAHSCAGHAATDGSADEWLFVPKGLCDRLVNGSTTGPKA